MQPLGSQIMDILQPVPFVMKISYFAPRSKMSRGRPICGSSNNIRGHGKIREGNVGQVDEKNDS